MWFVIGFCIWIAIIWLIAVKLFPHTVTWKEGALMLGIQSILMVCVYYGSLYGKGHDVQILNGQVTNKYSERVSCEHSYKCRCYQSCSGSGKNRSCTEVCSTCYDHSYDMDWIVKSDIGSTEISRVNRQGTKEPPRWTAVYVGEPFSKESSYYNYIKASPFSIFNRNDVENKVEVPVYPSVKDYYKIERVIDFNSEYVHDGKFNAILNEKMKTLGPTKKVNLVVVLHSLDKGFEEAYKNKSLGGKINDVTVLLKVDKEGNINSVNVYSWSKDDILNIKIRDSILDVGKFDDQKVADAITDNIATSYEGKDIKEFKYLDSEVELPDWAVYFLLIFGTLFPFVSALVAQRVDIFGEERRKW